MLRTDRADPAYLAGAAKRVSAYIRTLLNRPDVTAEQVKTLASGRKYNLMQPSNADFHLNEYQFLLKDKAVHQIVTPDFQPIVFEIQTLLTGEYIALFHFAIKVRLRVPCWCR